MKKVLHYTFFIDIVQKIKKRIYLLRSSLVHVWFGSKSDKITTSHHVFGKNYTLKLQQDHRCDIAKLTRFVQHHMFILFSLQIWNGFDHAWHLNDKSHDTFITKLQHNLHF